METMQKGAAGLHIDDHLGTAGGLFAGACYCDRCVEGFRKYLAALPESERKNYGLPDLSTFNYRDYLLNWVKGQGNQKTNFMSGHGFAYGRPTNAMRPQNSCRNCGNLPLKMPTTQCP